MLEPAPPLAQMAMTLPERPQCPCQPEPQGGVATLAGLIKGGAQVVVLQFQTAQPSTLVGAESSAAAASARRR